jgi:N-acetylmuramoyl-L-alanine amidase
MDNSPKLIALPNGNDRNAAEYLRKLEIDVLARTIWGEARGEGKEGMEAVASVILNRVAVAKRLDGYWWGNTVIQVCQKPYQFSCWNKLDPNFKKLISVDEQDMYFATALRVAHRAMLGFVKDPTKGATHYHALNVSPDWAKGHTPTNRIGHHVFYALAEV